MGRAAKYDSEAILDAALTLVAEGGPQAATIGAIAGRLGAPTGSIYHRFASRELILAELWIREIGRFQTGFIQALDSGDAEAAALHGVRWSRTHTAEATVLMLYRREDLCDRWPAELGARLRTINDSAAVAYRGFLALHPDIDPHRLDFAIFDLPFGAVRRHLAEGRPPPGWTDDLVRVAVKSILEQPR
ncbi:TetR/AcrR family transcriptional regulator [Nocardia jejuensis]|uniref:TetR/AcrR family transcriptional regulator n=1 Tax=Nocardia jejuensis TaxID=328049 RepID=UPI00083377F5|nr:TetR/AcrR family transcriptional regulator [Nocardia jejuensis]